MHQLEDVQATKYVNGDLRMQSSEVTSQHLLLSLEPVHVSLEDPRKAYRNTVMSQRA